ncbi:MAG: phosphoglycolate phosphatase [Saprospiraceae bacterium]|jgi:phosphoglycolate phosphatase
MSKHILFDLDGTLTDSSPGIINSILFALNKMGVQENDQKKLRSFVGPSLASTFKDNYFPDKADQKQAIKYYREYFSTKGIYENSLYEDVKELLDIIKSANYKIALATAKPTFFANIILNHFKIDGYFDVVIGSHLTGTRTDKKEIIHEVKDQLGLPHPETCTMIGDREYDILGGKHHQMNTIGVSYGYAKDNELQNINPDYIVHAPLEIVKIICP